ncbi:MAG TPA: BON domain-containing protein [Pseudomonadales bacterium]
MKNIKSLGVALLLMAGCASTATQQAPGEYVDDATITTKVKAALISDSDTKARHIEVETFRGVVQLSGFVESENERQQAITEAKKVSGVKSVRDNLALRDDRTAGTAMDDSVVTAKVKSALVANPVTKARQINVTTVEGVVQLSGFVDSANEKATAMQVAKSVAGVHSVKNELETKPAP